MGAILVTGGAGFIGSHLVERLLDRGATVRVLDNLSTGSLRNLQTAARRGRVRPDGARNGAPGGRLEVVIGDIQDCEIVRKAARNVEAVFHLAAIPSAALGSVSTAELESVNVQGTLNVLQAAVTEGVPRLVFASSASVYGTPDSLPVSETCPLRPESLFAASKLAAETYCRTYSRLHDLDVVTLRYFTVYGPRQRHAAAEDALIPELIEALRLRHPGLPRDDGAEQDLTYVDDAVEATCAAVAAPRAAGRTINIGSGRMSSVLEIVHLLYHLLRVPPLTGTRPGAAARPSKVQAATALAVDLLGCTPKVPLPVGLSRVVHAMAEPDPFEARPLAGVRCG